MNLLLEFFSVYYIVNCMHIVIQQLFGTFTSCMTETLYPLINNFFLPQSLPTTILLPIPMNLSTQIPLKSGIHQGFCVCVCDWLISLSMSKFPFLRLKNIPPLIHNVVCIYYIFLIHSWTLSCFHILAIVNNAAVNTDV